jgi:hypothetical protein
MDIGTGWAALLAAAAAMGLSLLPAAAMRARDPLPPAGLFYVCYGEREFMVYRDGRTGRQGLAMSYEVTGAGYSPRACSGRPGEYAHEDD